MWYELILTPDDNDTLNVTAPAFSEVTSSGGSVEHALRHGLLAIDEAIAARRANGEEIPAPVKERRDGTYYVGFLDVWSAKSCEQSIPEAPESTVKGLPATSSGHGSLHTPHA